MPRLLALPAALLLLAAAPLRAQGTTAPAAAPAAAAPRAGHQSWTSDRRTYEVGDVITVMVDEFTEAEASKHTTNTDSKRRDMSFDAELPAPAPGAVAKPDPHLGIRSSNDGDSRQRGDAVRSNRFQSEMSVRVVAIDPHGLLQVKGAKLVNVDKQQQVMTLTGWVRPQDVTRENVVASARVADAQLVYEAKGNLGKARTGIVTRVLGALWP